MNCHTSRSSGFGWKADTKLMADWGTAFVANFTLSCAFGQSCRRIGDVAVAKLSAEERKKLDKSAFAFPKEEKEPLENASHVRNAIARFNQVKDVSDAERDQAWQRILAAARKFGVDVAEGSWRELKSGGK